MILCASIVPFVAIIRYGLPYSTRANTVLDAYGQYGYSHVLLTGDERPAWPYKNVRLNRGLDIRNIQYKRRAYGQSGR